MNRTSFFVTGAVLFLAVLLTGCVSFNPVTGERELILISSAEEIRMGRKFSSQVPKRQKMLRDERVVGRVKRIGAKIAEQRWRKEIQYEFDVIDDDKVVNAFAYPGGFIFVTTGLLNKLKRDDDVAAVLAHEVGHVEARHSVKSLQAAMITHGLTSAILGGEGKEVERKLASISTALVNLRFSRRHELQADSIGIKYAFRAGFDPWGMINVLEVLAQQEKSGPTMPAFLRTHPLSRERLKAATKRAADRAPRK